MRPPGLWRQRHTVENETRGVQRISKVPSPMRSGAEWSKSAQTKQNKVLQSLLEHWPGLTVFVDASRSSHGQQSGREHHYATPVTRRKNYYGSGSIWSAQLAATLFAILQTLVLWGINPRHWLMLYLDACANNGGKAPAQYRSLSPLVDE